MSRHPNERAHRYAKWFVFACVVLWAMIVGSNGFAGVGVGVGVGRHPEPSVRIVQAVDYTTRTPGVLAEPSGMLTRRSSDASVRTGAASVLLTVGGSDVGRVGYLNGYVGREIEGGTVNYCANPRAFGSWSTAGSPVVTSNVGSPLSPDGSQNAERVACAASPSNIFQTISGATFEAATYAYSVWAQKAGTPTALQFNVFDGGANIAAAVSVGATWSRWAVPIRTTTQNTSLQLGFADARDHIADGGIAAGAEDVYADLCQFERDAVSSYAVPGSPRAPELVTDTLTGPALHGRLQLQFSWVPDISQAAAVAAGRTLFYVLSVDDGTRVYVDVARRQVGVSIDGVRSPLPATLPTWVSGDRFDFALVGLGANIPGGTYRYNGGAVTSLGTGSPLPAWRTEGTGTTLNWFASARRDSQLQGVVLSHKITATGAAAPSRSYYASPTGGGGAAGTPADLASLARALALARANLPARVVLHGGTYTLAATLAFTAADNGLEVVGWPGEVPVLSGGVATSGWVDDGSGDGVSSATLTGVTRHTWTNGTRNVRARSAQITSGWTKISGGFTAPDSTISGYARPLDVELVGWRAWKFFRVGLATASADTLTARSTDWTNAQSQAGVTFDADGLLWYENARELITSSAGTRGYWYLNTSTHALYYKPRAGESLGSDVVTAGKLEQLVTVTGTSGALASPVFRGITFSFSDYEEPSATGYSTIQSGIIGTAGADPTANAGHKIGSAIVVRYGAPVFSGCTFSHLAASALAFETGTQGAQVLGSTFTDIGGWGISFADVQTADRTASSADRVSGNLVQDSYFSGTGVDYPDCPSLFGGYSVGQIIDHNEFNANPISHISLGWGWNQLNASPSAVSGGHQVTGNRLYGTRAPIIGSVRMQDEGVVYVVEWAPGVVISGNWITRTLYDYGGIYIDAGAFGDFTVAGPTITGNVDDGSGDNWLFLPSTASHVTATGNYWAGTPGVNDVTTPFDVTCNIAANDNDVSSAAPAAIKLAAGRR